MYENNFVKTSNFAYKMLDFLPDSDPLKNRAKEKVLAILEKLTTQSFDGVLDDIAVLENYLKLGVSQGWLNNMNFLIIIKEYQLIKDSLQKEISNVKPKILKDIEPKSVINKWGDTGEKYTPRQGKILEILSKKEKAQVADLIKQIPKVTKRTIRRDLDDLLKRGKIVRVGEWNQVFYQKMS